MKYCSSAGPVPNPDCNWAWICTCTVKSFASDCSNFEPRAYTKQLFRQYQNPGFSSRSTVFQLNGTSEHAVMQGNLNSLEVITFYLRVGGTVSWRTLASCLSKTTTRSIRSVTPSGKHYWQYRLRFFFPSANYSSSFMKSVFLDQDLRFLQLNVSHIPFSMEDF